MTVWAYKSGRYSTTLSSHHGLSDQDEVKAMLKRMDGTSFYSFCLWKVPEGIEFVDVDLKKYPQEYIQCAGSAKRMTVEVRTIDDGTIRQVVLGKKNRLPKLPASIKWEKLKTKVRLMKCLRLKTPVSYSLLTTIINRTRSHTRNAS